MESRTSVGLDSILLKTDKQVKAQFEKNRMRLSFSEYIALLAASPEKHIRGSSGFLADAMSYFGTDEQTQRFKLFDQIFDAHTPPVIGQEVAQNQIYRALRGFSRQGHNNKLILLHGPNGSAKTSLVHSLMAGAEAYSATQEGALYSFNWIFPLEKITKGGIGIQNSASRSSQDLTSYAHLNDEEIAAKVPSELKDHPLLLIPKEERRIFLSELLGDTKAKQVWEQIPAELKDGELNHRCKQIFDALLNMHDGDFRKVLRHVQVERFFLSRRFRKGLVTIEPQMHVDAQFQWLSVHRNLAGLPQSLQALNLFSLSGDLIDANRGVLEFSDILKRPIDSYKYLLTLCETSSVNVGLSIVNLDTVLIGSANEHQLDAFKEFPDFASFRARIELIRVPYLTEYSKEAKIYEQSLDQIRPFKFVAPHTAWCAGLWAVLTRLKKPNGVHYSASESSLVSNLKPLEKAMLYDRGDAPAHYSAEEKRVLKSLVPKLKTEFDPTTYYEGRVGASAREIKSVLFEVAERSDTQTLTPLSVLKGFEELTRRTSEHEFLRQDVKDGYYDSVEFIQTVRSQYLSILDREVRESIGLYDSKQYGEYIRKYIQHTSLILKKEKLKNPVTGQMEDPDFSMIAEFEKIVDAPQSDEEKSKFRQNSISQVGAWSLDHKNEPVDYAKVFPDFYTKIEKHYFESQKALLLKMRNALLVYHSDASSAAGLEGDHEGTTLARTTLRNMVEKFGYSEDCAREVVIALLKLRY